MSNRLEHEFPAVRWHRSSPRQLQDHLVNAALVRGKRMQAAAIRHAVRTVIASAAQFIRCGAYGIAKRAPDRDCGRTAQSGA